MLKAKSKPQPPEHLRNGKLEFIDPTTAALMLQMIDRNLQRKMKPYLVDKYVRLMKEGFWLTDLPSTILISITGKLMDGQHRLRAVVQSGIGQWFLVFRNCPESIYPVIDTNTSRNHRDVLSSDIPYSGAVTAALTLLYQYERGILPGTASTVATPEKEEVRLRHSSFVESVCYVMRQLNLEGGQFVRGRRSILILCHYLGKTTYPGYADDFIHQIATGDGASIESPAYLVRNKMASYGSRQSLKAKDINILTASMFNTFVTRKPAPKRIRADRDLTEFPSIAGSFPFGSSIPSEQPTPSSELVQVASIAVAKTAGKANGKAAIQ